MDWKGWEWEIGAMEGAGKGSGGEGKVLELAAMNE